MSKNIVLVTGGFDPLHSGHIAYFKAAKQLGDCLFVGVNSDLWLTRKKGRPFMACSERLAIIENLSMVDRTLLFDDGDGSSIDAIKRIRQDYPHAHIIFANGGDRTPENIPEMEFKDDNISFLFGVGGSDKQNSSSWLLDEWKQPKTLRDWGYYRVLHEVSGCKVKELTVEPGMSLSMQKHNNRNEYWLVSEGMCHVQSIKVLDRHDYCHIPQGEWHKIVNPYNKPCKIVEIQYGSECVEEDIERKPQ